ncbi:MAG: peptidase M20 [Citromicrobium sp.]|nr:peptidase M20 [Citromicrobium sp.]MAK99977.1 peptidase M20 [Citromicrobium sp.]MAO96718.1 peptidase M20 [Citromicrobium sp.]MBD76421.1 peptidase M20 [Citromicrobium sp.]MBT46986.1 peptidase M20 [Citromicrobium sp.]|tara:strand:+ start:8215 stop:9561 length:1347 start_codon:yes stop_codon:yes gene_type:complete
MIGQVRMAGAIAAAAGAMLCSTSAFAQSDTLREGLAQDMPELMALYRDLHEHPELSFEETETSAKLAARARAMGFDVTQGVGKTGVVAVMKNGEGPTVLIRADMDALPVVEQTGLPFASTVTATPASGVETGVMHACGHDTHMAAWIGAAQQLVDHKDQWSGTLVMILQPAEELGLGALAMLEDGLYERFPKPDYAIAFHDAAQFPAGMIGYAPGYALANVDSVDITVKGIGGHGAYPQTTRDPIVLASAIVMKLQTLVSRELSPLEPGVVTVGSFRAGSKHNIISDEAKLQLTVRSYTDESRKLLLDGIARIARGEAIAAGLPDDLMPVVTVEEPYTPSTYNDPELTESVIAGFRSRFGEERVMQVPSVMGGEDFGQFHRAAPDDVESFIFWVGGVPMDEWEAAQKGEATLPSLHSPLWAPDAEKVIATGAEALAASAMQLMPVSGS